MGRANPARKLALVGYCPQCFKERRVVQIMGREHAVLAVCGHVIPRSEAR